MIIRIEKVSILTLSEGNSNQTLLNIVKESLNNESLFFIIFKKIRDAQWPVSSLFLIVVGFIIDY